MDKRLITKLTKYSYVPIYVHMPIVMLIFFEIKLRTI